MHTEDSLVKSNEARLVANSGQRERSSAFPSWGNPFQRVLAFASMAEAETVSNSWSFMQCVMWTTLVSKWEIPSEVLNRKRENFLNSRHCSASDNSRKGLPACP